jgi:predicted nucleic acid-binding protein
VIAYFDTSSLIPLVIEEPGSEAAARLWDAAERVVAVRVAYPEGRSALARAQRLGRLTARRHRTARRDFEDIWIQLDRVEISAGLAQRAGDLAETLALRGYDAIHLAAAETLIGPDLVVVAGDEDLLAAAGTLQLATART